MSLADVSRVLWRQRELVELLLFKLDVQQLMLATGRSRWLSHATREVDYILDRIREFEAVRAVEVEAVRGELGITGPVSLRDLADRTDEPWSGLFRSHREALLGLTNEIASLAEANRDLVAAGARSLAETLSGLVEATDVYDAAGRKGPAAGGGLLVDQAV